MKQCLFINSMEIFSSFNLGLALIHIWIVCYMWDPPPPKTKKTKQIASCSKMQQQAVHPLRFGLWFKLKNHIWQEASLVQWLSRQPHTTRSNKVVQLWFWSETLCGMPSMLSCLLFTKSYPFKLRKILIKTQTNKNTVICQFFGGFYFAAFTEM